jgi:hypothetical protein
MSQKMYRAVFSDSVNLSGLWNHVTEGTLVELDGRRLVSIGNAYFEPSDGWSETKQEALLAVAAKAEALAASLLEQARKIRAGEVT